jgi:hypothetical protein
VAVWALKQSIKEIAPEAIASLEVGLPFGLNCEKS